MTPEYLLKYMKAERDKALGRAGQLKKRCNDLKAENKRLEDENTQLKDKLAKYDRRISMLTSEVMHTPPYKDLMEKYVRIKRDNTDLLIKIGQLQKDELR